MGVSDKFKWENKPANGAGGELFNVPSIAIARSVKRLGLR